MNKENGRECVLILNDQDLPHLTRRERDIVETMLDGTTTNKAIANRLGISPHTVKSHLQNVYAKFNIGEHKELRKTKLLFGHLGDFIVRVEVQ